MKPSATTHRVRPLAKLPFFCHPIYLFLMSWALMLGSLELQVSELTYPDRSMGFILFLVSALSMLAGVGAVRFASYGDPEPPVSLIYRTDIGRLRTINWVICVCIVPIVIYNYISVGPPPLLGFFGISTIEYIEYGRFKQVLVPLAMALFVNSPLEESGVRRWFWRGASLLTLLAYVVRGPLLIAITQSLILYSIRTTASRRRVYVRALIGLLIALAAMSIIGDNRTAQSVFLDTMQIKYEFRTWPTAILWPISYISIPISNMCWIVKASHFNQPTISFLYPLLPSFWAPASPHEAIFSDSHLIDGVHTYLATYFVDFSWGGIVGCNFVIGLIAGFLTMRERISRNFMLSPIILSAIGFIFFWDFFLWLPTIIEFCVQLLIQKSCIVPLRRIRAVLRPPP